MLLCLTWERAPQTGPLRPACTSDLSAAFWVCVCSLCVWLVCVAHMCGLHVRRCGGSSGTSGTSQRGAIWGLSFCVWLIHGASWPRGLSKLQQGSDSRSCLGLNNVPYT